MSRLRYNLRRLKIALLAVLASGPLGGPGARAGEDVTRTGYFQTLDGGVGFVLDRSGETPKQRYDDSPEILLLRPSPAARGDTVFRQEDGFIVLRETPFGALTLFSRRYRSGAPVVRMGNAARLVPAARTPDEVLATAVALADHLKLSLGSPVTIEVPAISPLGSPALGVLAQAIENTGIAFDRVLLVPARRAELAARVRGVRYQLRNQPGVAFTEVILRIDFAPALGFAGRPSSLELEAFLSGALHVALTKQPTPLTPTSFDQNP
jgi:hypothetical protein